MTSPRDQRKEALECFYCREDGTKGDDWIHQEILNNPEADAAFRESAIRSAITKDGMTRAMAEKLYGTKPLPLASSDSSL